jgi:ketosteroid isomerase-like protein
VEIVRSIVEALNVGDMTALRALYDSDAVVRPPEGWPEPGPWVGVDAVVRQFQQMIKTWDANELEPLSDPVDAADRVVVRLAWHGAGQGPEANFEFTVVYTLRKGRVVYQETFWNHAEALEAVGLSEKEAHADS